MRPPLAVALLVVLAAGCTGPQPRPAPPAPSSPVAPGEPLTMTIPRASHTATRLPDGRVLIAGGCSEQGCEGMDRAARADLYDPADRRFRAGPAMTVARAGHTATALRDGRVLITGGYGAEGRAPWSSAETYDPAKGAFVSAGSMVDGRGSHTATLLADGRVLVVGGVDGRGTLSTVELYDPATGRFTRAAPLPAPRATHGAALLADGRVLVAGGQSVPGHGNGLLDTALLYDPVANSWREAGRLAVPKYKLAVAAVPGGAVVVGGQTADDPGARLATTEVFDPRTGGFTAGPAMAEPRYKISDAVALLPDGRFAVAGGYGVEVYGPGGFRPAGTGGYERQFPAAVALADGSVLVTGGYDDRTRVTATAFLATPG